MATLDDMSDCALSCGRDSWIAKAHQKFEKKKSIMGVILTLKKGA
jgi:hypothetical protein